MIRTESSLFVDKRALPSPSSNPLPDAVVAFRLSASAQRALHESLGGEVPIRYTADQSECVLLLQSQLTSALVVQVPAFNAVAELSLLMDLRSQFPYVSMTGIYYEESSDLSVVARLGSVGVLDIISADSAKQSTLVRAMLSRGHVESLVARIWRCSALTVADSAATVLRPAVRLAHAPLTLPRLAAAKKMHERSLRKYCTVHGLPSPQWIIGWARTLVIAYYLEEQGRSIQSISTLLGFSSSALLANHLRRYTGETASRLRCKSPLFTVARRLEKALTTSSGGKNNTG